ncbi:MAG: hypothetical protein Q9183_007966, partial [Haloplaca sp. 2 TL-2023]
MLKAPTIASAPALPLSVRARLDEKSRPLDAAQANVQARLFNSQAVKKVMDDCMGSVRSALGLDEPRSVKKKRMRKADYEKETKGEETPGEDDGVINGAVHTPSLDRELGVPAKRDPPLEFDQGSSSDSDSDYGKYQSRLAGSSSDESPSEDDLDSSDYDKIRQKNNNKRALQINPSLSPSPSPSQFTDLSEPQHTQASNKPTSISPLPPTKAQPSKTKTTTSTTFLPSLTHGGYISPHSSRSPSPSAPEKPKNRRGQRER